MTISDRDQRALKILGAALALGLIYWLATRTPGSGPSMVAVADTPQRAEKRLQGLRTALATVDGKEVLLKQASAEVADRERGLLSGDTADQAQAQLLQIIRRVASVQAPAIDIRQSEFGRPRSYGDAYGAVSVSISINCRTDELVNLLATLSQQPEIISTDDIRFGPANPKSKAIPIRLTVSGLVSKRLVPERKAAF